jgi:8-oxo-dGTP pyrophosphatase MutT (NUDIX family)
VTTPVRASGGVLVRDGRVLLVHRPKYDDWTFPKGKPDGEETDVETARREVEEETGYAVELQRELPSTRYAGHEGRPKVVRYWLMRPLGSSAFRPGDEVDEIRWLTFEEAASLLTWERDLPVLDAARRNA